MSKSRAAVRSGGDRPLSPAQALGRCPGVCLPASRASSRRRAGSARKLPCRAL